MEESAWKTPFGKLLIGASFVSAVLGLVVAGGGMALFHASEDRLSDEQIDRAENINPAGEAAEQQPDAALLGDTGQSSGEAEAAEEPLIAGELDVPAPQVEAGEGADAVLAEADRALEAAAAVISAEGEVQ